MQLNLVAYASFVAVRNEFQFDLPVYGGSVRQLERMFNTKNEKTARKGGENLVAGVGFEPTTFRL